MSAPMGVFHAQHGSLTESDLPAPCRPPGRRSGQRLEPGADRLAERISLRALLEALAVEDERRHAHDPVPKSAHRQLLHARGVHVADQLTPKARHVEPDALRVADEVGQIMLGWVLIELVIHRPKLALPSGGFGRLGRLLGEAVSRAARHVAMHEAQAGTKAVAHLLDLRVGRHAKRTLEVCVLDQSDTGITRAVDVIVIVDLW